MYRDVQAQLVFLSKVVSKYFAQYYAKILVQKLNETIPVTIIRRGNNNFDIVIDYRNNCVEYCLCTNKYFWVANIESDTLNVLDFCEELALFCAVCNDFPDYISGVIIAGSLIFAF